MRDFMPTIISTTMNKLSIGGEYGGIGSDFKMWTVRGRASVPF
jgi:hypothetical protein